MAETNSTVMDTFLVTEARKSKFSSIENRLNDEDVASIWSNVSDYIEKNMSQQKGVQVAGLGTFSFTQKKLEIGNNKYVLIQRPVFMVSEKFAQTHGLAYTKYHSPGQIPIIKLNYTALSCATPYERDAIELCIKEVLLALNRSVAAKKNIEFTFVGIGRLQIRDGRAKMKFFRNFINSMDGSGSLVEAMQNRAGTVDSVISDQADQRLVTPNTLQLPKMQGNQTERGQLSIREPLPDIQEDAVDDPGAQVELDDINQQALQLAELQNADRESDQEAEPKREFAPIATANCISFDDDLPTPSTPAKSRPLSQSCPEPLSLVAEKEQQYATTDELKPPSPPTELRPVERVRFRSATKSSCGHYNAGQEICYLCHQRERVNIPVTFAEERARLEREEDRLLQQFNAYRDVEFNLKNDALILSRKHENQKTAAFNLGVSEATKMKKHNRPTDFYPSYVFQLRPYTPPRHIKQGELLSELGKQCQDKKYRRDAQNADEQFLERLEQVQLAEDLAAQRDKEFKDKHDQQQHYKRALSAQVRYKPPPFPDHVSNSAAPFFGKDDLTEEKLIERRRVAHDLYREQVDISGQKKRDAILRRLAAQKEEEEVLKQTKDELLRDRAGRFDRMAKLRRHLEDNWSRATKAKLNKERDEFRRAQSPGILVHEQCDRYKRCRMCRRNLHNCGESNIWCDSRYIPGSRLIV